MNLRLKSLALLIALMANACALQDYRSYRLVQPPEPTIESLKLPAPSDPELTNLPSVPLIHLQGSGYSRGFQYGRAFKDGWHKAVRKSEELAVRELESLLWFDALCIWSFRAITNSVYNQVDDVSETLESERRMPPEYRAYIQGLADGAELDTAQLTRLIATVMMSDASCCGFIATGPATYDGRLLQLRNLDWGDEHMRPQELTVLAYHKPAKGYRYLSIGFVGLIGSVSGINEHGISLTEVGSETADKTRRGRPMPLMLEQVLAQARTLEEAIQIMKDCPGTGGYNFLVGSAKERAGAVIEKTAHHCAVFRLGTKKAAGFYRNNPYFEDFCGFDCRADTAADPAVRRVQLCSGGDPEAAIPPAPTKSRAYRRRYQPQVALFKRFRRRLTRARAEQIAATTAPRDNLHSILYDFERGQVWLRNRAWFKDGREPSKAEKMRLRAAVQGPLMVDLRRLFESRP